MQMKGDKNPDNDMPGMNMAGNKEEVSQMDHSSMDMSDDKNSKMDPPSAPMAEMPGMENMDMFSEFNYNYLKSPEKTVYGKDVPVNEILLNLTGNMNRYIWSMNGIPLSETDKIKIKEG